MWYVYILKSDIHRILYTGSTNDLKRRLHEHNSGQCKATDPFKPYHMMGYVAVPTETQARKLEKYFKTGSGRTVLKKRILNDKDIAEYEVLSDA